LVEPEIDHETSIAEPNKFVARDPQNRPRSSAGIDEKGGESTTKDGEHEPAITPWSTVLDRPPDTLFYLGRDEPVSYCHHGDICSDALCGPSYAFKDHYAKMICRFPCAGRSQRRAESHRPLCNTVCADTVFSLAARLRKLGLNLWSCWTYEAKPGQSNQSRTGSFIRQAYVFRPRLARPPLGVPGDLDLVRTSVWN
jgi:hypothetical protein